MDWWRAHHGLPYDTKLAVVAKKAGARRGEVCAIWVACLDFASQHPDRGSVAGIDPEEIAVSFDFDVNLVQKVLLSLQSKGLIATSATDATTDATDAVACLGKVTAWERRQPKREEQEPPKSSTIRSRNYRQKLKTKALSEATTDATDTTTCNARERPEQSRTEQIRTEQKLRTTTSQPVRSQLEYPKTAVAVREPFPSTDDTFVMRLVQATCQATISAGLKAPPDDAIIADAVRACFKSTHKQQGAGLFLQTVPQCVKTWLKSPVNGANGHKPTRDEEIRAMRELIASATEPAEMKAKWRQRLQEYGVRT